MLAYNESFDFFIDVFALEALILSLVTTLSVQFGEALFSQKLSNLCIVRFEVEHLSVKVVVRLDVLREHLDNRLGAHLWLIEGNSLQDIIKTFSDASVEPLPVNIVVETNRWEFLVAERGHSDGTHS